MMNKEKKQEYIKEMTTQFDSSAASTTVNLDSSSMILFKSAITNLS